MHQIGPKEGICFWVDALDIPKVQFFRSGLRMIQDSQSLPAQEQWENALLVSPNGHFFLSTLLASCEMGFGGSLGSLPQGSRQRAGLAVFLSLALFILAMAIPFQPARALSFDEEAAPIHKAGTYSEISGFYQAASTQSGWKFIHPSDLGKERKTSAMIHAPDLMHSDPGFAGLMFRCGAQGLEIILIIVDPLQPKAQPTIRLHGEALESTLKGSMISTGAGILLPAEAIQFADLRRAGKRLDLQIENEGKIIKGSVELTGWEDAMRRIEMECRE